MTAAGGTTARTVTPPPADVDVRADVDVAVTGATLTGVAAALRLAEAGHRAAPPEPGYSPGTDLTAANPPYDLDPADTPPRHDTRAWHGLTDRADPPTARPLPWRHDPHRADLPPGIRPGFPPAPRPGLQPGRPTP